MKNKEIIFIVEESLDGGFEARAVGYSIFTEAESVLELKENIVLIKRYLNEIQTIYYLLFTNYCYSLFLGDKTLSS